MTDAHNRARVENREMPEARRWTLDIYEGEGDPIEALECTFRGCDRKEHVEVMPVSEHQRVIASKDAEIAELKDYKTMAVSAILKDTERLQAKDAEIERLKKGVKLLAEFRGAWPTLASGAEENRRWGDFLQRCDDYLAPRAPARPLERCQRCGDGIERHEIEQPYECMDCECDGYTHPTRPTQMTEEKIP